MAPKKPDDETTEPEEREPKKPVKDDEEEVELDTEPEEGEGEEKDLAEEDTEPRRPTPRKAARAQRGQNRVAAAEERAQRAEQEAKETRELLLQQQRQILETQQQQQKKDEPDPLEEEWKTLQRETRALQSEWQNRNRTADKQPLTADEIDKFETRGWELERRKLAFGGKVAARERPAAPTENPVGVILKSEYADVVSVPQAAMWADARYKMRRAEGAVDTLDLKRAVLQEARERFRTAPAQTGRQPTAATKARFSSPARGATAGAGDERGGNRIVMTAARRKAADAMYPHIKDLDERYKHWAQTVGADIVRDGG